MGGLCCLRRMGEGLHLVAAKEHLVKLERLLASRPVLLPMGKPTMSKKALGASLDSTKTPSGFPVSIKTPVAKVPVSIKTPIAEILVSVLAPVEEGPISMAPVKESPVSGVAPVEKAPSSWHL